MLPRKTPLACLLACLAALLFAPVYAQKGAGANIGLMVYAVKSPQMYADPVTNLKWMQIEVQIEAGNNINPAAINKDFFERVKVTPIFAWGTKRGGQFSIQTAFDASVEIASMPARSRKSIYFYLPPEVVEQWMLRSAPPTFYYVEVSYAGVVAQPAKNSVPSVMQDSIEHLDGFKQFCAEKIALNRGILLPHNLAPGYFLSAPYVSNAMANLIFPIPQGK